MSCFTEREQEIIDAAVTRATQKIGRIGSRKRCLESTVTFTSSDDPRVVIYEVANSDYITFSLPRLQELGIIEPVQWPCNLG